MLHLIEAAERAFKYALLVNGQNHEASSNLGNVMMSKCVIPIQLSRIY